MRNLFIFAKHTRARESICICTCHALCRLLDCTTIMSSYLTIQFVVNARASKLQVMLAPPTKDIFLGLRQQVCSLLSQLYGWFLHTCNLTAWWKTQGTKYHITWKSALLWPNLLGLFCQNPLQVTVFCCWNRPTRWCTVSDTLIVDLRRNIIRVGSTRSALYLFQTPPHPKSLQPQPLLVHPEGKLALGMRKTWPFFLLAFPFLTCCKPVLANAKLDQ